VLLDLRLAVRMLARYPLLTIVSTLGMAFGLAAGVVGFEVRAQLTNPRLPLDDGQRIVGVRNWDAAGDRAVRLVDEDYRLWREQLTRFESLGAAALVERNLAVDGNSEPVRVAEITASGFGLARVPPVLGRPIVAADEAPGATPVAVIGHALWQRRFQADPQLVGRLVRLGGEPFTVVGVMPEGFGFPAAHEVWVPWRLPVAGQASAPALLVFGRLEDGVSRDEAQTELAVIGQRRAAADPATYRFVRPEIVPFAHLIFDPRSSSVGLTLANAFLLTLLVVVCANVALLVFARAASRQREISLRTALGASRGRIVAQLFAEALVLAALSVAIGLTAARFVLGSFWRLLEADSGRVLPFWFSEALTPSTVVYGAGLMLLAAAIVGVLPALKVTGRTVSRGGYRFGGVWTAVIATQVAVTLLFPAMAFFFHGWVVEGQTRDLGVPAGQYLTARLETEAGGERSSAAVREELRRQLSIEPGIGAVTFADTLPGATHSGGRFEVEGDDQPAAYGYNVRVANVDPWFFDAMGAAVAGRGFQPARDSIAVVNTSFVERVMRGRPAVGRRVRRLARDGTSSNGPWLEIVGVVRNLGMVGDDGAGLYQPMPASASAVHVAVRTAGAPQALANRLRVVAARVDPTLRLYDVKPLDQAREVAVESQYLSRLLTVLSALTLLLSLIAIYSVMAFTVTQQTREIGTRVALGADARRIVSSVIRRPLRQIGVGIAAGAALVVFIFVGMFQTAPTMLEAVMIAAYAGAMLLVCLSACAVPTRRALRLQPSAALRTEG
jgi:putative ABC transport system permease protein